MLIHAYRRTALHTVDLEGKKFEFKANPEGAFVCEVPLGPAAARLLEISEGYRAYVAPGEQGEEGGEESGVSPYTLTVEGEAGQEITVDLRELNLEQLKEFATANECAFHPAIKEPALRDKLVAFFKVE